MYVLVEFWSHLKSLLVRSKITLNSPSVQPKKHTLKSLLAQPKKALKHHSATKKKDVAEKSRRRKFLVVCLWDIVHVVEMKHIVDSIITTCRPYCERFRWSWLMNACFVSTFRNSWLYFRGWQIVARRLFWIWSMDMDRVIHYDEIHCVRTQRTTRQAALRSVLAE